MDFTDDLDSSRVPIGVEQLNRLRERIDIVVSRSGWFVVDDRLHVQRGRGVKYLRANFDFCEDVEETRGSAGSGKRRHIQDAGSVVDVFLDLTKSAPARIETDMHRTSGTAAVQIQSHHLG